MKILLNLRMISSDTDPPAVIGLNDARDMESLSPSNQLKVESSSKGCRTASHVVFTRVRRGAKRFTFLHFGAIVY